MNDISQKEFEKRSKEYWNKTFLGWIIVLGAVIVTLGIAWMIK